MPSSFSSRRHTDPGSATSFGVVHHVSAQEEDIRCGAGSELGVQLIEISGGRREFADDFDVRMFALEHLQGFVRNIGPF